MSDLYVEQAGAGSPVVLLHEGIADSRMWEPQWGVYAERYRVVRFDMRGFGQSPPAVGTFSLAGDLVELLDGLELGPATLVGVSLGGSVAMETAIARPDLVSRLVLVAPGLRGYEMSDETKAGWVEEEAALERGDVEEAVQVNLRMWVDGPSRSPDEVDPDVRSKVGEMQRRAIEVWQEGGEEGEHRSLAEDWGERLGELTVPTLILVGELDRPEMLDIAKRLETEIPNARRETIAATAHVPSMERPDEFDRLVLEFLGVSSLEAIELVDRIWAHDSTVWTGTDEGHWLGWLDEPSRMLERIDDLEALPGDFEQVVLLGMGGSSLAPEVIRRTFGANGLHVLDTTHPSAIRRLEEQLDLDRTLFVAASKSGTTLETRSQLDYFLDRGAGAFAAITDPGTELEQFANERGFLWVVHGEPTIGGRYSALSPFGIVPAVLIDVDARVLLERADTMAGWCRLGEENPGFQYGLELGESWTEGRDKVCIDETPGGFGLWAEQLLAESTGKEGKGLVPAPGESAEEGSDRQQGAVRLDDPYDLGAEFVRWEFATAVAGSILGINPFNQPDVQAAKDKTSSLLSQGTGPEPGPEGSLDELLAEAEPPQYIAIQAFIDPEREGDLDPLVARARETGCVVTKGVGPRYLHSTGQLHKGGPNSVLAVQVVDDLGEELAIPGKDFGFRQLIAAQAAGDLESLKERGRKVCRVRLEDV